MFSPESHELAVTPKQFYPVILNILWEEQSKLLWNIIQIALKIWIAQSGVRKPFQRVHRKKLSFLRCAELAANSVYSWTHCWLLVNNGYPLICKRSDKTKQVLLYPVLLNKLLCSFSAQLRCHYNSSNIFPKYKYIQKEG